MTPHLTEHDLCSFAVGERSPAVRAHLRECEKCAARVTQFEDALSGFRATVRAATPAPPAIEFHSAARPLARGVQWRKLAAACAAVIICVMIALWFRPTRVTSIAAAPDDTVLLQRIDAEVSRTAPASMEPLEKLVQWNPTAAREQSIQE